MSEPILNRVIRLLKKTGDRAIVMPSGEEPYVLMSFDAYERLVDRGMAEDTADITLNDDNDGVPPASFPGHEESERLYIEPVETP